jgi:membrane protein YdbS with pleckstrin-like domain
MTPGATKRAISVTHINVRESISFLLARLVGLDVLAGLLFVVLFSIGISSQFSGTKPWVLGFLGFLVVLQISLSIFIVLQWLNEYYEIMLDKVVHRKGIVYRNEKTFSLKQVRQVAMNQGFLGELFNYGTITLTDIRLNRKMHMHMIHNPRRYLKILEDLIPDVEEETDVAGRFLSTTE